MTDRIQSDLEVELHDVFNVCQVTRGTKLEAEVGADVVEMEPSQASQTHRHNLSETVLYFIEGSAQVHVNDTAHPVAAGDRLLISSGEWHSVSTGLEEGCRFVSVQCPPILNKTTGFRDLEPRV